MDRLTLETSAKINLSIDVTGKRENGYHDVKLIFQEINLSDRISLSLQSNSGISVKSESPQIPTGEKSLAYRAARAFLDELGCDDGLQIEIVQRVPTGAGLGGGSADAAGVLNGLNALYGNPFPQDTLLKIGVKLGADIPFCIMGGCAVAEGIGEKLTPLPMPPKLHCVLAKPEASVSTKWVYEKFDTLRDLVHPEVDRVVDGIRNNDLYSICRHAGNILESVTVPAYPVVGWLKDAFQKAGAVLSLMSGSGSAVFGLFETLKDAKAAAEQAKPFADKIFIV